MGRPPTAAEVQQLVAERDALLAHAAWQTQDEWYIDRGRYINGQVPSYQGRSQNLDLAARETRRGDWVIVRRTAIVYSEGYFMTDREAICGLSSL